MIQQAKVSISKDCFAFDAEHLFAEAENSAQLYSCNTPFPHIVLDNFLRKEVLELVIKEFPGKNAGIWNQSETLSALKKACGDDWSFPDSIKDTIRDLQSKLFLYLLGKITGIGNLIPDNYLVGSGLFRIERGGFLKVHADFNIHPLMQLDRRINLLLYLNEDWKNEYGGDLELWENDQSKMVKSIRPIANRCVIFSTTDTSFHGHPSPLNCPEDRSRNCISLYYYTNGRPENEKSPAHNTIWKE